MYTLWKFLVVTTACAVPVTLGCLLFFILGPSLLRAKNQDGKSALDVATSLEIKALLESVGREDKFIEGEAKWQHGAYSALVSQLLPVLLHSYLDTYLTLHIENELKNHMRYDNDDINTLHVKRIGRPKLKFDYLIFLKDYKSLRKLKDRIRDESKKVPRSEMIGKFLFLLQWLCVIKYKNLMLNKRDMTFIFVKEY